MALTSGMKHTGIFPAKRSSMKKIVVAAMSGGVDSSVAAHLLREQGYEVIGLTMDLYDIPRDRCEGEKAKSCCGWRAKEDAGRVAAALGISHYVVDLRREFSRTVIDDFCREYALGRTPNPCIRCNESIKFKALAERAGKLGADFIATGHYARVSREAKTGRYALRKGLDGAKDQSYFLSSLTQAQLAAALFPLGELTKSEVRRIARRLDLEVADRPESQEVCFVPGKDYAGFVARRCPEALVPGPIVDTSGRILGRHAGIIHYTIGQRKGMGIAAAHPFYVLAIDPGRRAIIVGRNEELYKRGLVAERVNFVSVAGLAGPTALGVKIRYRSREAGAVISPEGLDRVRVVFAKPQRAVTPGQSAVFYDGDEVVGGGIIREPLD